jgi:hypothetical protein
MAIQRNAPLPDGLHLGGHRIIRKLACGGFSIVYLARAENGKAVAIKEYLPSGLVKRKPGELVPAVSSENLAAYHVGLKHFFDEGRALARIAHPNVVSVVNFFRANYTVYMVMTYESGHTLQEHIIRRRERLTRPLVSERFIRNMFGCVMNGLREVHSNKLLHLDVKPANIYVRRDGTPILLDFGAARQMLKDDASNYPIYTPGFAPPEVYEKIGCLGPWSDIYSTGASMFSCMVGAPPQPADQRKLNDKMDTYFEKLEGHYSPSLIEVIRWSLMMDPAKRPHSVFEMQKALQIPFEPILESEDVLSGMTHKIRQFLGFGLSRQST